MTAKESGPGQGTGREGAARRPRGGRSRRTHEEIVDNIGPAESAELSAELKDHLTEQAELSAKLGQALDELIDSRYPSRTEFARAVDSGGYRALERRLSERIGGKSKERLRWKEEVRLVVDNCCPPDRSWISELARIAGLWARANEVARPGGYYGPVFPQATAEAPGEHLDALTEDFPRASQPPRRCPGRDEGLGLLLRGLVVVVVGAALLVAGALAAGPGAAGQCAVSLAFAGIGIIALAALARPPRWHVPLRPDGAQMVCSPPQVPETWMITEVTQDQALGELRIRTVPPRVMYPVPASAVPARLGDALTWRLEQCATIVTPLALGRGLPQWLAGLAGCVDGSLGIAIPAGASGEQPRVEWALVDDDGRLHATGLLPPPPDGTGDAVTVLVPEYGQRWVTRLPLSAPAASAGEHAEPGVRYLEASLAGTLFWPWRWSQVNVVLRRLDTLPCAVHVRWRHAGLHMHRLTRRALSTTTSAFSAFDPAGHRFPVTAGSKLELFTSGHESAPGPPGQFEVTAKPYEARDQLILLRLGQAVPFSCYQCATHQMTPWIAMRPGQDTPTCRNCFLASHPATGE